jgi:hypothetical protein
VATNISLIADAKVANAQLIPAASNFIVLAIPTFLLSAIAIVALIFIGTKLSNARHLSGAYVQVERLLADNSALIDEIGHLLVAGAL